MAITLNPEVWGSNEQIIFTTNSGKKHARVYYPYYKATDEEYKANPNNIISITEAVYNGVNNLPQSTTNNFLDYSICSWSIPAEAAINNVYMYGSYYDRQYNTYLSNIFQVSINDETAYPAFFTATYKKQNGPYTVYNNPTTLQDDYGYTIDFNSVSFGTKKNNYWPANYPDNSPYVSFGYKASLNFLYVVCCTEEYFYNTVEWGDIVVGTASKLTTVNNTETYLVALNDYYNRQLTYNGETKTINEFYPIVLTFCTIPSIDTNSSDFNVEDADPVRTFDDSDRIQPMPVLKMKSFKELEPNTIFGTEGVPWYNWNNVYNNDWGRVLLGMSGPRSNYTFTTLLSKSITTPEQCLARLSRDGEGYVNTPHFLRSHKPELMAKEITTIVKYSGDPIYRFGYLNITQEELLTEAAYLGIWFTTEWDGGDAPNINLYKVCRGEEVTGYNLENFYMPIFDEHMITTGRYISAAEINKNPTELAKQYPNINWGWEFNLAPEYKFDYNYRPPKPTPGPEDDKERPSDKYTYNTNAKYALSGGNYYIVNKSRIEKLKDWMRLITKPAGPFVYPGDKPGEGQYSFEELGYNLQFSFGGAYPEDQLISLMYYPFNITKAAAYSGIGIAKGVYIKLGYVQTYPQENWFGSKIEAVFADQLIEGSNFIVFESGEYLIEEYYHDFRDYPPYTTMSVMIPYHGTIPLDVGAWYGHKINTRMIIDIISGTSTTIIERDGIPVSTIDGQVGVPVQLIARNVGDYVSTLIQGSNNVNQQKIGLIQNAIGIINTGTSLISGADPKAGNSPASIANPIAAAYSGITSTIASIATGNILEQNYENTQMSIAKANAGTSIVSSHAPSVAEYFEPYPRLITHSPRLMSGYSSSIYGRTVGFACSKQAKVKTFSGFSVFSGVDLDGISAPEEEKHMIFNALKAGVII